jgi:hypothetical protein
VIECRGNNKGWLLTTSSLSLRQSLAMTTFRQSSATNWHGLDKGVRINSEQACLSQYADLARGVFQVIMVVGAGRGPLVRASLAAAHETQRRVRVYAVEKNPNAVVTLHVRPTAAQ